MNNDERKRIVRKAADRMSTNLEKLKGYARTQYLMRLVDMLDDTRLEALDFAIDMTPEISEGEA